MGEVPLYRAHGVRDRLGSLDSGGSGSHRVVSGNDPMALTHAQYFSTHVLSFKFKPAFDVVPNGGGGGVILDAGMKRWVEFGSVSQSVHLKKDRYEP